MHSAVMGALVGLGVAVVLFLVDYLLSRSLVAESAKQLVRRPEMKANEKRRIASLIRFLILLPPVFGFAAWVMWG